MKVKQLIEKLEELNMPDAEIYIASDAEGNGFLPFEELSEGFYSDQDATVFDASWDADDAGMEEDEWEEFTAATPKSIVFWP